MKNTQKHLLSSCFFRRTLPQDVIIESGRAKLSKASNDRRIFTFNSKSYNSDLSTVELYSVHFWMKFEVDSANLNIFPGMIFYKFCK